MSTKKSLLWIALLSLSLSGCGKFLSNFSRLPNESTTVSFKSDRAGYEAEGTQLGGVMFYLMNTAAGGQGMIGGFASEDAMNAATLTIPNGVYQLYALGYAGPAIGGGQVRCGWGNGGAVVTLSGGSVSVPIDISQPNCNFSTNAAGTANDFSAGTGAYSGNFNPWTIRLCTANPTNGSCGLASTSDLSNVRITMMAGTGSNGTVNENPAAELTSACNPITSGISSFSSFNMPISPVFVTPIKISFYAAADSTCSAAPLRTYQLNDGLKGFMSAGGPFLVTYGLGSTTVSIARDF